MNKALGLMLSSPALKKKKIHYSFLVVTKHTIFFFFTLAFPKLLS